MLLFATLLMLPLAEAESPCSEVAQARIESASALIAGLDQVPDVRKAMEVERARILLERVLAAEPKCTAASTLKNQADRLFEEVEVLSSDAAAEQVLARAERLVIALEEAESPDRAELQAVRFLIAALAQRLPDEPKVLDLAKRARAVGDTR